MKIIFIRGLSKLEKLWATKYLSNHFRPGEMENNNLHLFLEDDEKYRDNAEVLKSMIVTYENFPKPGITYK